MILDALILQSKLFLSEDMDISIKEVEINQAGQEKLILKDYTSMIGTGGKLNLMIVISFEKQLLDQLIELFMDGEEVDEEEQQEIIDSVAGEVINTIIGLALPTFPHRGKGVTITPPITINDASNIKKHKNSKLVSANIDTEFGSLSISALGSEEAIH
ncbi:MAG: chemotaxis protein CheX [Pseudomonadota bacterium]